MSFFSLDNFLDPPPWIWGLWGELGVQVMNLFGPCSCRYPLFLPHREEVEKRFEGRLTKNMSGSLYEMVSRVMKALVNRKITVPGNFQG